LEVLATLTRSDLLNLIALSEYVGVIIDEGTDASVMAQLVVYYKLLVHGNPLVVFAGVEYLKKGDAETIHQVLLHRLKKDNVSVQQLVSFGSDGASVMLGHKSGVAGRLLAVNPILVAFHCVNHQGALGIQAAAEELSYLKDKFFPTLEHIGRYFRYSHTRVGSFKDAQERWASMADKPLKNFIKIAESAFTRWLTHGNTVEAVRRSFVPLVLGLRADAARGDVVATGILHSICTLAFVGTLAYMADIFPLLNKLSLVTQRDAAAVDLGVFFTQLPLFYKTLEHMRDNGGDENFHFGKLDQTLGELKDAKIVIHSLGMQNARWLGRQRRLFHVALIKHLKARYPEHALMRSMWSLFSAKDYPKAKEALQVYLDEHILTVSDHYAKSKEMVPDVSALRDQLDPGASGTTGLCGYIHAYYTGKKRVVVIKETKVEAPEFLESNPFYMPPLAKTQEKTREVDISASEVCTEILNNATLCQMYPACVPLLKVFSLFTISSAECERGVSVLKLTKTDARNRMRQPTLEQLMVIKTQGKPATDVNWEAAAITFFSKKTRRAAVDTRYTSGKVQPYVWGHVYVPKDDREPEASAEGNDPPAADLPAAFAEPAAEEKSASPSEPAARGEKKKCDANFAATASERIVSGSNPSSQKNKAKANKEAKAAREKKRAEEKAAFEALSEREKNAAKKRKAAANDARKKKAQKRQEAQQAQVIQRNKRTPQLSEAGMNALFADER
jgi:hypothetical protein